MLDLQQLVHQPFWLASIGGFVAAWVLAVAGTAVSSSPFLVENFAYWALAFAVVVVLMHAYCVLSSSLFRSRVALCAFNAIGLVYTSRYGDAGIIGRAPSDIAAGTGFILISVIMACWILALGIDGSPFVVPGRRMPLHAGPGKGASVRSSAGASRVPMQMTNIPGSGLAHHPPSASSLGSMQGASNGGTTTSSTGATTGAPNPQAVTVVVDQRNIPVDGNNSSVDLGKDVEFKYKGTALYTYNASPDDPNELSFVKGESLDIVDTSGKWWQARKSDGSIGIVPSNYIKLAD